MRKPKSKAEAVRSPMRAPADEQAAPQTYGNEEPFGYFEGQGDLVSRLIMATLGGSGGLSK